MLAAKKWWRRREFMSLKTFPLLFPRHIFEEAFGSWVISLDSGGPVSRAGAVTSTGDLEWPSSSKEFFLTQKEE